MTFAVGSTVEQRYPGANADLARASARDRVEAFKAAGWDVREERWVPDSVGPIGVESGLQPTVSLTSAGALVVVFVAAREASLPPTLKPHPVESEPGLRLTGYFLRLVVGLIVFAVVLAILFSVGLPIVGTLMGTGTPKPLGG